MGYNFSTPVNNYNVLIADPDRKLAGVIRAMLKEMGFSRVEITHSGDRARELLQELPFDALITEWDIEGIDGITLINHIRNDPDSPNPRLPIIMLTDRTDQTDVAMARDTGINEFVVKPFSAKTLFEHLEHIIDKRRAEERARAEAAAAAREKAEEARKQAAEARKAAAEARKKAGETAPEQNDPMAIAPVVLDDAQAAIDAITTDSLQWIKKDLAKLKWLHQKMVDGETNDALLEELRDIALNINSQANQFGYGRAAEIANRLHLFFFDQIQPNNANHQIIVQKHIEVLQVIFGNNILGMGGSAGEQIAAELNNLMRKYAS